MGSSWNSGVPIFKPTFHRWGGRACGFPTVILDSRGRAHLRILRGEACLQLEQIKPNQDYPVWCHQTWFVGKFPFFGFQVFFKIEDAPLVHLFGPRSRGPIHVESQVARPKSYLIGSTNRASWPNKWRLAVMFSRWENPTNHRLSGADLKVDELPLLVCLFCHLFGKWYLASVENKHQPLWVRRFSINPPNTVPFW